MASGRPFTVAAHDQHVDHASVADLGEHREPELGALTAVTQPHAQHVLVTLDIDAHAQVGGPIGDGAPGADLHHEGVDVEDRVDRVEGSGLPLVELIDDPVGHLRDQRWGHLDLVHAAELAADVAGR